MRVSEILLKLQEDLRSISYGGGVYSIAYPAYYNDGAPIMIAVKLEHETEVVLERDEEVESMALLSTSDEYTIMDLGSVMERYSKVANIEDIIKKACDRNRVHFDGEFISIEADTATTCAKLNRYLRCIFEIETRVLDLVGDAPVKTEGASEKLMAYLKRGQ